MSNTDIDYYGQNALHNCFTKDTEFITNRGVKKFSDFKDGDTVTILDKEGKWREATVRSYGKQPIQQVTFKSCRRTKTVRCTPNHRWILKDGTVTTELQIGEKLKLLPRFNNENKLSEFRYAELFCIGFVLGDGTDGRYQTHVRLCGDKTKYRKYFEKANYRIRKIKGTNDLEASSKIIFKQTFLNQKQWKYFDSDERQALFEGLYAADGRTHSNSISFVDERYEELVRDICSSAGYYFTSKRSELRDTNFKKNSVLHSIYFAKYQTPSHVWQVTYIEPISYECEVWCVEEPVTHSFILEGGMVTGNCELLNLEDMLQHGTVMNEVLIEKPHRIITAATICTQICAAVTSCSYGGATITLTHLAPFVRDSYNYYLKKYKERGLSEKQVEKFAKEDLDKEIADSVQTFNYQLNSISNVNGQSPFLSVFMYLGETEEYKEELALLIEEFLKQRILGMKNEKGVFVSQAFPKLLYVLEEDNVREGSKYYYLTELAAKCTAKRMVPDYISEKIMLREKGDCYPCIN